jgi:hypothetical protein
MEENNAYAKLKLLIDCLTLHDSKQRDAFMKFWMKGEVDGEFRPTKITHVGSEATLWVMQLSNRKQHQPSDPEYNLDLSFLNRITGKEILAARIYLKKTRSQLTWYLFYPTLAEGQNQPPQFIVEILNAFNPEYLVRLTFNAKKMKNTLETLIDKFGVPRSTEAPKTAFPIRLSRHIKMQEEPNVADFSHIRLAKRPTMRAFPEGFDINQFPQKLINALIELQSLPYETGGYVNDNYEETQVREGNRNSVEVDILPEELPSIVWEFHCHPQGYPYSVKLGDDPRTEEDESIEDERTITKNEAETTCATETEVLWSELLSPTDAYLALHWRYLFGIKNLLISKNRLIEYYLNDSDLYDAFRQKVLNTQKSKVDSAVGDELDDEFHRILREEGARPFEVGKYGMCARRDKVGALHDKWWDFLRSVGLTINVREEPLIWRPL